MWAVDRRERREETKMKIMIWLGGCSKEVKPLDKGTTDTSRKYGNKDDWTY